ncbi:MAG TPA: efflux transporter outer membrane subunit [Burkholderiales bacterium]|nr:efflux transporter outer membrane subunit [Burkholderiales bacterium]
MAMHVFEGRPWIASALIVLLAAGCASMDGPAPRSSVVAPETLDATKTLAGAHLDRAAWPANDWWTRLGDGQLDELESEALAGSPTLRLAQARLAKARARTEAADAALQPQVEGDLTATRKHFSENHTVPPPFAGTWRTASRFALDFDYEFDFWGKNRAALQAALGEAEAARVDAFAARLMLSVAVARAYVQLARLYDRLDVANATLKQRQQIYDLTRQRIAAGLDTRVELKQAEAALPATREEIAALEESIALTRNLLAALAGRGPDRGLAIARPALDARATVAALPARLPADLMGRRPDVVASRWRVEAAAHGIAAAKTQFYPDVNLLAFVGFQSIGLSQLLELGSGIAGVGPALRLPVFEGGRLRAQLAARDADYDAAVERYNTALIEALHDIGDRLASIRSVTAQRREQQLALDAAREAYHLAVLRYREGIGSYLSVLSAQSQVLAQQRLEADLRARDLDNRIELVRALGGGFETHAAEAAHRTNPASERRPS